MSRGQECFEGGRGLFSKAVTPTPLIPRKFSARGDPLCIPTGLGLREWLHVGYVLIAHQCHCRQVVVAVMPPVIQPVMDAAPRMVPKGMRLLQHGLTDLRR